MKLELKPVLILILLFIISGSGIVIGAHLFEQYKLNRVGFEVTRVEVDTTFDWQYREMCRIYFYIEHDGEPKKVKLRMLKEDSSVDTRFWDIQEDTEWIFTQFFTGENETFEDHLYKLTAQRFDWAHEPVSNEVTVWNGETSNLPILTFKQTFGIEVTKVRVGNFERFQESAKWDLLFYLHNYEEAENVTFELKYTEGHSGGSADIKSLYVEEGDNIISLESLLRPELDLDIYKLTTDKYGTLWFGLEEAEVEYLETESLEFTSVEFWFNTIVAPPPLQHGLNESLGTEGRFTVKNLGEEDIVVSEIKIQLRDSTAGRVLFESSDWNKIQYESKAVELNGESVFDFFGLPFIESPLYGNVVVVTKRGNTFRSMKTYRDYFP